MAESVYYGLQKLAASESLPTNDYKFSWSNVDAIDRILYKINIFLFDQAHPIGNPVTGPTLSTEGSGGSIPAAVTLSYKYTYVDPYGNETAASPGTTISTPAPISPPNPPTISYRATELDDTPSGTLSFGTYFYVMSAYVGTNIRETSASSPAFVSIPGEVMANAITLGFPSLPAGATGFVIYKRGPGQSVYYYLDSVDMYTATPQTEYVDNGSVSQNITRTPAIANTTNAVNAVTITLPVAAAPPGYTWKIYRSYSGNYDSSLLYWVTEETATGSGVIRSTYLDVGTATTIGQPPTRNLIFGDLRSNLAGGAQVIDVNEMTDDPLIVPWSVVTAGASTVVGEGTFYRLLGAPGVGTAQQAYITRTVALQFDKVYAIGCKFTLDQGPLSDSEHVKILSVGNDHYELNICLHSHASDGTVRYMGYMIVDGVQQYLNMPLDTMPYANSLQFRKTPIINNVDRIDTVPQYLHCIIDLDGDSRFVTKPSIQVFINGILTMYGDFDSSSALIPGIKDNLTALSVGLMGYVGPFGGVYTQANNFSMLVDYIYLEEYPGYGREFNQIREGDFSHTQIYKAHQQYEAVTKKYLTADSTRSGTTLLPDTNLALFPISNQSPFVEFQGLFKYAARTTEDLKFKITLDYNSATPWTNSIVEYTLTPYNNVTSGTAGKIYTGNDTVVLGCAGVSTYNMIEIKGFVYNDLVTPFPAANSGTMYLTVYWAKNSDDATPGTATLSLGSFMKIIDQDQ